MLSEQHPNEPAKGDAGLARRYRASPAMSSPAFELEEGQPAASVHRPRRARLERLPDAVKKSWNNAVSTRGGRTSGPTQASGQPERTFQSSHTYMLRAPGAELERETLRAAEQEMPRAAERETPRTDQQFGEQNGDALDGMTSAT